MKELRKKINGYLNTAMLYAVLLILLGAILLIFPGFSLDVIRWSLAIFLIGGGLALLINDLRRQYLGSVFFGSLLGVLLLIFGIIVVVHPDVMAIIPVVLGIYMIISSVMSLRLSASLKSISNNAFVLSILTSIVSILCGIVLIVNPFRGAIVLTSLVGIVAIVYGVAGLVDLIVFRHNIDEVSKYIKAQTKVIEGKEAKD